MHGMAHGGEVAASMARHGQRLRLPAALMHGMANGGEVADASGFR